MSVDAVLAWGVVALGITVWLQGLAMGKLQRRIRALEDDARSKYQGPPNIGVVK